MKEPEYKLVFNNKETLSITKFTVESINKSLDSNGAYLTITSDDSTPQFIINLREISYIIKL